MKKTRLLTIVLASVFVCGMAAACGTQNTPAENGGTENKEPAGGDPVVQKTPQEIVWEEAAKLEFTNVTITSTTMGFTIHENGNGEIEEETVEYHEICKIDAANRRIFRDHDGSSYEVYEEVDGVPYIFSRGSEGAPWSKETGKEDAEYYYSLYSVIPFELGAFEDYTYEETTGKYVTTVVGKAPMRDAHLLDKEKWEDYFVKREVKIEDGKLVEFYGEGNDGRWQRYVFSDYGTTVVPAPKEGSRLFGGDPHVTADEWADNIKLPYTNVTMDVIMSYDSDPTSLKMATEYLWDLENHRIEKAVGAFQNYSFMSQMQTEYFAQTGNEYVYIDAAQTKTTDVNGEKYQQNTPQGFAGQELTILGAFEEYTYDENGEYYVSTAEKTTEERTYTKRVVQFEDGKIRMILLEFFDSEYGMSMTYEIVFSDYGKTAVEIPTL